MATSAPPTSAADPPPPPPRRGRARTLAAALCGGLGGLVAGTALVALAPAVDRSSAVGSTPSSSGESAGGRPHRVHVAGVSAVLLPAIDAGVRSSPVDEREGNGP